MRDELCLVGFKLAREIERVRRGRDRWRCPVELRRRAAGYARMRHAAGFAWEEVARELGVGSPALRRWVEAEGEETPGALVPVSVRGLGIPGFGGITGSLTLVSPAGYRLEGLDLASAARLLEELG